MICKLASGDLFFVTSLPKRICERLMDRGYELYIFSVKAPSYAFDLHGYNPYELGIHKLEVQGESAFFRRASHTPDGKMEH
jgi:hypothetical protein